MKSYWLIALAVIGLLLSSGCSAPKVESPPKAAIIDQLSVLRENPEFISRTRQSLEAMGFQVDTYTSDQVTVGFYRQLPAKGYKLIIFRVHSGILGVREGAEINITEGTWLFTSEEYSAAKYPQEQLTKQMGMARIDASYPWVFAIGAEFVKRSMKGKFPGTVVIAMGCSGLRLTDLAESFVNKGASVFVGWQATVDLAYTDDATLALVQKLVQLPIKEAVSQTMAEKGPDPTWGAILKYYPPQQGDRMVKELIR
ncbi:MAG: hypothetical protein HY670_05105 [Chloroflexi bacterium]|nr:hypothetical protein [Chloroflexota bacterium]